MCQNLIQQIFPEDTLLRGAIIEKKTGHVFFSTGDQCILTLLKKLKRSGAVIVSGFRGFPGELIKVIKSLNEMADLPGYNPVSELKSGSIT